MKACLLGLAFLFLTAPCYAQQSKCIRIAFVQKGENLPRVAQRCGTTIESLIEKNKLKPPYHLYVGQSLMYEKMHTVVATKAPAVVHVPSPKPQPVIKPEPQPVMFLPQRKPDRPLALSVKGFIWPLKGKVISKFGEKSGGLVNDGINIKAALRTSVMASEQGDVVYAGNEIKGFGNLVLIKHADDWTSAYGHNDVIFVKKGDRVTQGQVIAKVGNTGNVSTPQLHFELRKKSTPKDPRLHLK